MMPKRIFSESERAALAAKPGCLAEAARVAVSAERLAALAARHLDCPVLDGDLVEFSGGLSALDAAVAALHVEAEALGVAQPPVEFLALSLETGRVYLVNTEGYDYPRYLGVVSDAVSASLLGAR